MTINNSNVKLEKYDFIYNGSNNGYKIKLGDYVNGVYYATYKSNYPYSKHEIKEQIINFFKYKKIFYVAFKFEQKNQLEYTIKYS